jgi:hypothetical protein
MFLILFNLVSLYFIIDLLSYDEIIGYLTNGEIKSGNPRNLAFLLFVNGVSNLFLVSVSLMSRLLSGNSTKAHRPKQGKFI